MSIDIEITEQSEARERRAIGCTVDFESLGYRAYVQVSDDRRLPDPFRGPRLSLQISNFGMTASDWARLAEAVATCLRMYENRWPSEEGRSA